MELYRSLSPLSKRVLFTSLSLYSLALLTSMAGMEIFAWSTIALVGYFLLRPQKLSLQERLGELRVGLEWPLLGLLIAVLISELVNGHGFLQTLVTLGEFRWMIILYAVTWALPHADFLIDQGRMVYVYLLIFLITAVIAYFQFENGIDWLRPGVHLDATINGHFRAQGFFNICNTFAYAIGVQSMLFYGRSLLALERKSWQTFAVHLTIFICGTLALYFSFTRGAWIAWAVAIIPGTLLWRANWKVLLSLTLVASLLYYVVTHEKEVAQRVTSISDTSADLSNTQRLMIWKAGLFIVKQHPLFGVGWNRNSDFVLDAYKQMGHPESKFVSHNHNDVLQTLGGLGFFGLFFYAWLCLQMLWKAFSLYRRSALVQSPLALGIQAIALGSLMAQIYFHLGSATQCNFIDAEVNHNLMWAWAFTLAAEKAFAARSARQV